MIVPLYVTAKNEARFIRTCLDHLMEASVIAKTQLDCDVEICVVLDDCNDETESIVRSDPRLRVITSSGGLVEAQRTGVHDAHSSRTPEQWSDFIIFSDADILVEPQTISTMVQSMQANSALQVCYPKKEPLPPNRWTLMSSTLYSYNLFDGFKDQRKYFNGKFFAIRNWKLPTIEDLNERLMETSHSNFYCFHEGLKVDDVLLSRLILAEHGEHAIQEVTQGKIWFRPPATFHGMYLTYKRMRMEWERLDILFPETRAMHQNRRYDRKAYQRACARDKMLWWWFRVALQACKVRYLCERIYYEWVSTKPCNSWQPVEETKTPGTV